MGSLKNPSMTSYLSSVETIVLNYLVFEKTEFVSLCVRVSGDR